MSPAKEIINSTSWDTLFDYDTQHRLTSIQGPGNIATPGGTVGFEYTDLGAVSRLNLGITEMQLDYDPMGRLTAQTLYSPMQRKYIENTYYPDGKVHTYTQDNVVYSYTYDFAGRLIEWDKGSASPVTYSYDKAGNLVNPRGESLTFNEANEISNASYSYDDAGNLKQDEKYKYTWDGEGRLSTVTTLADVTIADYTYHYDGLRKSKTVGSDTYYYHYDGSNLIRITDDNEETVWAITWSGMSPVMLTNAAGETYYYVTNYRGDVVNILDEEGYPVASYRYDPWGNPEYTAEEAAVAGQPIRYASYVYDGETGHYYLQARYYDPETARFISRDAVWGEIGSPLSQNLYGYCEGDPVNYVDPTGYWAEKYPGFRRTSRGFDVNVHRNFLSKIFCYAYALDIIIKYGSWSWRNGWTFKGMNAKRIAVELYAHAVGYYLGHVIKKINKNWGRELIERGRIINVNNNDPRAALFYALWAATTAIPVIGVI